MSKPRVEFVVGSLTRIGGVSSHVNRLLLVLTEKNIPFKVSAHKQSESKYIELLNTTIWLLRFLFMKNDNLIHFHKSFGILQYLYWFMFSQFNSRRVIITIHNSSLLGYSRFKLRIALNLLRRTRFLKLIVVSDRVHALLTREKISGLHIPAYIPNVSFHRVELTAEKKLFMYSVFVGTKANLLDIYGFDIALRLLKKFRTEYKMLFMLGNKERSDVKYIERTISEEGLQEDIEIIYNCNLVSYINNCEFILRPNRQDGYGISLQEALDQDIIAIASDVCMRPKGTITYENFEDLVGIVSDLNVLSKDEKMKLLLKKDRVDSSAQLVEIYRENLQTL
jgi:hypothetical protein